MISDDFTVSVVIPAYNEAPRITRALRSVLDQTHPVNEIIVVDDGSTDDTSGVVAQFSEKVICVRQSNQGLSAARNTGISRVKSDWVAFLDADDEWLPSHIENAKIILTAHPEIIWYCAAFERRREDGVSEYIHQVEDTFLKTSIIQNYFAAEAETSFSRPSSMLVKREVFKQTGMFNVEISSHGEDLDMWFRIALYFPRIAYCLDPGCIYWQRAGSITSTRTSDIPRFVKRINITRSASSKHGESGRVASADVLVNQWVRYAIKDAIKQKDTQSIGLIEREFSDLLSGRWKLVLKIFKYKIAMNFVQILVKMRAWVKGIPQKQP